MPQINAPTPDATTVSKGKIQLAGDLTGSASAPTLSTTAIKLGYAQITSNFVTAGQTPQPITGLSVTVTIPSGGRSVKITGFARDLNVDNAAYVNFTIWDGAVGTGTQIGASQPRVTGTNNTVPGQVMAIPPTPSAGSKTYSLGFHVSGNTGTLEAGTTYPAFILVELI